MYIYVRILYVCIRINPNTFVAFNRLALRAEVGRADTFGGKCESHNSQRTSVRSTTTDFGPVYVVHIPYSVLNPPIGRVVG